MGSTPPEVLVPDSPPLQEVLRVPADGDFLVLLPSETETPITHPFHYFASYVLRAESAPRRLLRQVAVTTRDPVIRLTQHISVAAFTAFGRSRLTLILSISYVQRTSHSSHSAH